MSLSPSVLAILAGKSKSAPRKLKVRPRRVDFWENRSDHDCALFASMGFSTKFIQERTDLSPGQITYRIRAAGLDTEHHTSRMDFRNGTSPYAKAFLRLGTKIIERDLMQFIKDNL